MVVCVPGGPRLRNKQSREVKPSCLAPMLQPWPLPASCRHPDEKHMRTHRESWSGGSQSSRFRPILLRPNTPVHDDHQQLAPDHSACGHHSSQRGCSQISC